MSQGGSRQPVDSRNQLDWQTTDAFLSAWWIDETTSTCYFLYIIYKTLFFFLISLFQLVREDIRKGERKTWLNPVVPPQCYFFSNVPYIYIYAGYLFWMLIWRLGGRMVAAVMVVSAAPGAFADAERRAPVDVTKIASRSPLAVCE